MHPKKTRAVAVWLCLLLAACGARSRTPATERPIDHLRERARKNPNDRQIWSELALAEHLEDGGDPEGARKALVRAQELGGRSLRLDYVAAEQYVLEGRPADAFEAFGRPGHVKVRWEVQVRPAGDGGSFLSIATRFTATDDDSRARLLDAWGIVGPLSRSLARRAARTVQARAEAAQQNEMAA
jgi:hypothetical protein